MKQCCSYFCKLNNSLPSQSASEKHQLSAMNRRRNIQFRRRLILFFGIVIICLTLTGSIFLSNYYGETMNTTSLFIQPQVVFFNYCQVPYYQVPERHQAKKQHNANPIRK